MDGVIAAVLVTEGQVVKAGELIARLACDDLEAEIRAAKAAENAARQAKARLVRGSRDEERHVAAAAGRAGALGERRQFSGSRRSSRRTHAGQFDRASRQLDARKREAAAGRRAARQCRSLRRSPARTTRDYLWPIGPATDQGGREMLGRSPSTAPCSSASRTGRRSGCSCRGDRQLGECERARIRANSTSALARVREGQEHAVTIDPSGRPFSGTDGRLARSWAKTVRDGRSGGEGRSRRPGSPVASIRPIRSW